MSFQDTERAVKIFKEVVSGRIVRHVANDMGVSSSRIHTITCWVGYDIARRINQDMQWWKVNNFRGDSDFWLKAADDYLINWRESEEFN
jgi:FixJ family two-component response regulator